MELDSGSKQLINGDENAGSNDCPGMAENLLWHDPKISTSQTVKYVYFTEQAWTYYITMNDTL